MIVNCGDAIELSPSLALAHFYLGISLVRQGRLDESLEEFLKARELDPLSSITARQCGYALLPEARLWESI